MSSKLLIKHQDTDFLKKRVMASFKMLISNVFSTLSNIYQTRSDEISKAVRLLHYKQYNKLLLNKNLYDAVVETMKHEKTCLYNLKICIDYKSFPKHKKNIAL